MVNVRNYTLCSALIAFVYASPIQERQSDPTLSPYSLPNTDEPYEARAAGVEVKRATFTYGQAIGAGPFSPDGELGNASVAADTMILEAEMAAQSQLSINDSMSATADSAKVSMKHTFGIHDH